MATSPDGRRIVSGSADQTVRIWDADSGAELACLRGHTDRVWSVATSPDGRRILSGSDDQTFNISGAEPSLPVSAATPAWSIAWRRPPTAAGF